MMQISVIICTWNRAGLLSQTLKRMSSLRIPENVDWELIVVNNNCTDETAAVVQQHQEQLPIRMLYEPTPGKSHALNLAAREARGQYLVYTDDDVLVDPMWIESYCDAFKQWPEAVIFGGSVDLHFEGTLPRWLERVLPKVKCSFAARDFGRDSFELSSKMVPFGVNMAVKAEVQRRYLYDPMLGPRVDSGMRGEETTLVRQMLADGLRGRWVPDAKLHHFISKHRQTTHFLREFFESQGELAGLQMGDAPGKRVFGRPRWLWRIAIQAELRYRFERVVCRPDRWINSLIETSELWGQLRGIARAANHNRDTVKVHEPSSPAQASKEMG